MKVSYHVIRRSLVISPKVFIPNLNLTYGAFNCNLKNSKICLSKSNIRQDQYDNFGRIETIAYFNKRCEEWKYFYSSNKPDQISQLQIKSANNEIINYFLNMMIWAIYYWKVDIIQIMN